MNYQYDWEAIPTADWLMACGRWFEIIESLPHDEFRTPYSGSLSYQLACEVGTSVANIPVIILSPKAVKLVRLLLSPHYKAAAKAWLIRERDKMNANG